MPEMQLPLVKGERQSNLDYRDTLPVNFTAVVNQVKGDDGYLLSHDGLIEFAQTNGKARGGVFNERFNAHYRVSGDTLEEISSTGEVTVLGVTPGDANCLFANSFNTQAIISDGKLFLWDNASLIQVIDTDLGVPIDITWFRGIFVMTDGESLFHTDIANEFSISPLKYSSSEFASDKIIAVARNDENQIIAFNRYSTEYFYFKPDVPFGTSVLQVISGKASKIGIVGVQCKVEIDGIFFILGGRKEESPSLHILNAGQETTIATREIDKILSKYTEAELSGAVLEARVVDRDKLLIVHLKNETLIYNHTVAKLMGTGNAWSYVKSGVDIDSPWRAKFGVFDPRSSKWIYGDTKENKLGYLDSTISSQYGEQIEASCYTPIIKAEGASIDSFEIETISGFSTKDISVSFCMSYDGVIYGKEYFNKISTPNNYNTRYIARALGYIRYDFNFKFRFVSVDKMAFSGLSVVYS